MKVRRTLCTGPYSSRAFAQPQYHVKWPAPEKILEFDNCRCHISIERNSSPQAMDPLGATASVFTLVDASVSTLRAIDRLLRRYQNVPEEIIELKHRLNGLNSQLVLIKHVQAVLSTPEVLLIGSGLVYLEQFLQHTSMLFQAIRHYLEEHIPKTGTCARLKWALQDAQRVREWEHKLRSHAGDLSNIMILLNL